MNNISAEQKIILGLLGKNLFATEFVPPSDANWAAVLQESRAQTVFSVIFHNYQDFSLAPELAQKVKESLIKHALINTECFKNHSYLHRLMTENGIDYCVVKGVASAAYYPDPLMRSMGDVDFYVHPNDIDAAREIFKNEGFVANKNNHPHHISMNKGKKHFEMHFYPIAYRPGWVGDVFEEYWSDILKSSAMNEIPPALYRGPSEFHHGFILLTHLQHHLFNEGVGLRHFCDWALFVDSLTNEEFISIFESRLKRIGLYRLAQILSLGAVKYMGLAHREWMGDDYDTAEELLFDIMCGGNFGRKDRRRVYEGLFIAEGGADNVRGGRLGMLMSSMNKMVDAKWRAAKKIPLLYPIGWMYFSIRYLFRVITKKRKLNVIDNYRKSGERNKKYRKLKVFEPEE